MSSSHAARRAVADILSVCRHAGPASAARWLTALTAHVPEDNNIAERAIR